VHCDGTANGVQNNLEPNCGTQLRASSVHGSRPAHDVAPGSSNKITLTAPAGLVRVRVIDRDGDPVPGATLGAGVSQRATLLGSLNLDYALGSESFKRRREIHTMAPGEVSLVLSPGEYFFVGSAPGYQHVVERFELNDGERGAVTLTLVRQ
jgi:hypothetical protein